MQKIVEVPQVEYIDKIVEVPVPKQVRENGETRDPFFRCLRLRTLSNCQVQVPVAVKSVKHVEVLQMEYQDEDVHVPVPQISRYDVAS